MFTACGFLSSLLRLSPTRWAPPLSLRHYIQLGVGAGQRHSDLVSCKAETGDPERMFCPRVGKGAASQNLVTALRLQQPERVTNGK